jgi:hypothetical protein
MEGVFIGATRAEATRMADDWWARQKGVRQTLRTEVVVGRKAPAGQLDQWALRVRLSSLASFSSLAFRACLTLKFI